MEYKVIIERDGMIKAEVLNRGVHKCTEIINVVQSFGQIVEQKPKEDKVPVFNSVDVRGS